MKTIFRSLHLIIYTVVLYGCENEIPYNPTLQKPQLIMNALLDAGASTNLVYLHWSEGNEIGHLDNAALSLYVNGQLAETPKPLSAQEIVDKRYKAFRLTTPLHPGDNIRLEGTAKNDNYQVSAEVLMPHPIDHIQVDTFPALLRLYNSLHPYRQYKIGLKDRPDEKNYYRLEIINDFSFLYQQSNDAASDATIQKMHYTDLINREDIVLTDGRPVNSDDEENEKFPTIKNKYNVFTDNRFSNATTTLKVYTQLYENLYPDALFQQAYRTGTITIRILSITEAEYRYLKALNSLESDDYDNTLMEPISLPCNVKGGLGFVGAHASSDKVIQFPETIIYPLHTE